MEENKPVFIGVREALKYSTDHTVDLLKQELEIDSDSSLLFFNTEGATDPVNYHEILYHGKYPSIF